MEIRNNLNSIWSNVDNVIDTPDQRVEFYKKFSIIHANKSDPSLILIEKIGLSILAFVPIVSSKMAKAFSGLSPKNIALSKDLVGAEDEDSISKDKIVKENVKNEQIVKLENDIEKINTNGFFKDDPSKIKTLEEQLETLKNIEKLRECLETPTVISIKEQLESLKAKHSNKFTKITDFFRLSQTTLDLKAKREKDITALETKIIELDMPRKLILVDFDMFSLEEAPINLKIYDLLTTTEVNAPTVKAISEEIATLLANRKI